MKTLIQIDPAAKEPMYLQLYHVFSHQILFGTLKEGEYLPSKRALCDELKISHSTVENAYAYLVAEGYIESVPRKGYRVLPVLELDPYQSGLQDVNLPGNAAAETSGLRKASFSPANAWMAPDASNAPVRQLPMKEFSTAAVDTEVFPYASWTRLYRETLYTHPELLERGDGQGDLYLREALCDFLSASRGVKASPEQVVVGAGVSYLLDLLLKVMPGAQRIAVESPGYRAAEATCRDLSRDVVPIPLDNHGILVKELAKSDNIDLCFVTPSHQFPTGVTMSIGRRTRLLNWAEEHDAYIIEDDYDSEFRYETRPIKALQGIDLAGRVIFIGTFSRSIAPSIRVAYMVLPEGLVPVYQQKMAHAGCSVSRVEQRVIAEFLSSGMYMRHVRRCTRVYKERKEYLESLIGKLIPEGRIEGNEAGLHFVLYLDQCSGKMLEEESKKRGLRLQRLYQDRPGCVLLIGFAGMTKENSDEYVRILKDSIEAVRLISK